MLSLIVQCEEGDASLDRPEGSSCTDIKDEILEEVEDKQESNKVGIVAGNIDTPFFSITIRVADRWF